MVQTQEKHKQWNNTKDSPKEHQNKTKQTNKKKKKTNNKNTVQMNQRCEIMEAIKSNRKKKSEGRNAVRNKNHEPSYRA